MQLISIRGIAHLLFFRDSRFCPVRAKKPAIIFILPRAVLSNCERVFLVISRHDNAQSLTMQPLANNCRRKIGVAALYHPRHAADLAPVHYFLLPRLKLRLKGRHFTDASEIQQTMKTVLIAITLDAFSAAINLPRDYATLCINNQPRRCEL